MENLVRILEISRYHIPAVMGPFHIISIMITIGLSIFVGIRFKGNTSMTTYKKMMFTAAVFFIFTEVWKLFIMSFPSNGDGYFRLREFPFQLSSLPLPVMLIASLTKNERLRQLLNYFMATYLTLGGLAAVVAPESVFRAPLFIPLQSIALHIVMFLVGVYLYTTGFVKFEVKSEWFKRAVFMFLGYFIIAQGTVILAGIFGLYTPGYLGLGRMFADGDYSGNFLILAHISPWFISNIPVARDLQRLILGQGGSLLAGYLVVCVIYIIGATGVSYIIFNASELVKRFYNKFTNGKTSQKTLHLAGRKCYNSVNGQDLPLETIYQYRESEG